MTSEELIDELIKRFQDPVVQVDKIESLNLPSFKEKQTHESKQNIIRLRVLNTIKRWITNHVDNFIGYDPSSVVDRIRSFIQSDSCNISSMFDRERKNIIKQVDQLSSKDNNNKIETDHHHSLPLDQIRASSDQPSVPFHNGKFDIFKYSPEEIAKQITIIDYYIFFKKIQVSCLTNKNLFFFFSFSYFLNIAW